MQSVSYSNNSVHRSFTRVQTLDHPLVGTLPSTPSTIRASSNNKKRGLLRTRLHSLQLDVLSCIPKSGRSPNVLLRCSAPDFRATPFHGVQIPLVRDIRCESRMYIWGGLNQNIPIPLLLSGLRESKGKNLRVFLITEGIGCAHQLRNGTDPPPCPMAQYYAYLSVGVILRNVLYSTQPMHVLAFNYQPEFFCVMKSVHQGSV